MPARGGLAMASVLDSTSPAGRGSGLWPAGWPVAIGLAALYLPTYFDLARGLWTREEYFHGPIVLAVALWLGWSLRVRLAKLTAVPSAPLGAAALAFGLAIYVVGRSQDILIFEIGSQIPVFASLLLFFLGPPAVRVMWFPLLYLGFMLPLPGFLVDALTGPMKQGVSAVAENLLYYVGYPIARNGVVLSIGQYQLLVADACSGLNSLFSILAMGLLYVYLMNRRNAVHNGLLILSLVPIALLANLVRVLVLVLVTFHFGDEAGQGFIHGFSGIFLFVVGLLALFGLDALAGRFLAERSMVAR